MKQIHLFRALFTAVALLTAGMLAGAGVADGIQDVDAICPKDECEPFFFGRVCKPNPWGLTYCDATGFLSCRTRACPKEPLGGPMRPRPRPE